MASTEARYAIARRVDLSYDEADRRIRDELQQEGFGILTEIDLKATLKQKLDVDISRYAILGACAPQLAHQALQREPDIGLLLPCNVVVRETEDGGTVIEALDPITQIDVAGNPDLNELAREARGRIERALDRVAAG